MTLLQNPYSPHYPYKNSPNPSPSKSLPTLTLHHPLNNTIPISNLFLRHIFWYIIPFQCWKMTLIPCSFQVGISGSRSSRFGADTASIFILPALYCFSASDRVMVAALICLFVKAFMIFLCFRRRRIVVRLGLCRMLCLPVRRIGDRRFLGGNADFEVFLVLF